MAARRPRKNRRPADFLITKRREAEAKRAELQATVDYQFLVGGRAKWENKTHARIAKTRALRRFEELKAEAQRALDERRRRLADKLSAEQRQYETEVEASFETTEQRNARMTEKALRLKAEREQRRLRTVEECRARQFRGSCDELRGKDVAIEIELNKRSWDDALAYKQEKRQELDREAAEFAQTWEADRISKMKREEEEAARRAKWNSSTKGILDQQVQEKAKIEQFRREQESVAARKDIERWQREIAEEKRQERTSRATAFERYRATMLENKKIEDKKKHWNDADIEHTRWLIAEAIRKEEEDEARQRAERMRQYREAREYQEQLQAQMIKEAADEGKLERLRREDQERAWKKREDQWAAEAAARAALQKEVLDTRALQIQEKEALRVLEKEMEAKYAVRAKEEHAAAVAADRQRAADRRQKLQAAQTRLLQQIQDNDDRRQKEVQAEYFQQRLMKRQEKLFEQQLSNMRAEAYKPRDFRKKKAGWYS